MRTDKEKMDFAKACLVIEKKGGNVQKYIALNWPSYTPRATWYNIQRVYLGRSTNELTEGRPNIEKGDEEMRKQKNSQDETAKGLLDWVRKGRNPATYLAGEGFASPATALRNIKDYAKKHYSPEIVEEICRITLRGTKTAPAEPKPSENPPEEVKAPETVVVAGKEYEKMGGTIKAGGLALPPFDTSSYENEMIAPAYLRNPVKPSGPIKWDDNGDMNGAPYEIAMEKLSIKEEPIKKLKLRTLQGEMGTYEKLADDRMLFTGIPRPFTDCGYTVAEWFVLIEELQIAMQQLGLSK